MSRVELPPALVAFAARGKAWADWLDNLPGLVSDILAEWGLTVDGPLAHGYCALVVPVRAPDGRPAVAKFSWPHDEEEHEHIGLKALAGAGAALLYRADPARHVMLLERLHADRDLTSIDVLGACEVVAGLYACIHIAAPAQLRPLTAYVRRWNDDLRRMPRSAPIPRRLVEQAVRLADDLSADPACVGTMIHGDLHYENVLAGDREPWLVIDPKPMSGDPHYEVAPMLWNRWEEAVARDNLRAAIRRRFETIVSSSGLDEERARDWVVVRMVHNAMWSVKDAADQGRGLDREDREWITRCVALAKAVQD
ncbi:MAG: aminoglycoside phosphotransferase family protein [Nocardioidaceae bacterium]